MRKGAKAFLTYVKEVKPEEPKIKDIRAVRDFFDIFPDDLPRLPPTREIKFAIDLTPNTELISRTPYRMALAELKELKE